MQLVVFSHNGDQYALPIAAVSEIIRHAAPRSVSSETPGVRGVIGLRGKIVPIIDLADRLGLESATAEAAADAKIIILDVDGAHTGVIVDEVDEVLTITDSQVDDVPSAGRAIEAVAKVEDRLVLILDAATLVGEPSPPAAAV
jgi:purine-binding chemotaxis protein CheW